MDENKVREIIRDELEGLLKSDRYTFAKTIQILNGRNIALGTGDGTKIGTETTQRLGFFNATPVIQQTPSASNEVTANSGTALNNNSTSTGSLGSTAYRFAEIVAALKNLGLIAQ
jgi:hypothetical protein